MKKEVKLIILIGVLLICLTGCNAKGEDTNKVQENKPTTAEISQKADASKVKEVVKTNDTHKINAESNTVKNTTAPTTTPAVATKPIVKETTKTSTAPAQEKTKPAAQIKTSEYFSNTPVISTGTIQISPKHVYYKDSVLYMDAYVYNGFNYNVFNIKNIGIKLSNDSGVIAEANFEGLENKVISPKTHIIWTFVFSKGEIKQQNANLQILNTKYKCDNSY